jgi:hypothetical protein
MPMIVQVLGGIGVVVLSAIGLKGLRQIASGRCK